MPLMLRPDYLLPLPRYYSPVRLYMLIYSFYQVLIVACKAQSVCQAAAPMLIMLGRHRRPNPPYLTNVSTHIKIAQIIDKCKIHTVQPSDKPRH